jgi:hypothetical protein
MKINKTLYCSIFFILLNVFVQAQEWQNVKLSIDDYVYNDKKELTEIKLSLFFPDITEIDILYIDIGETKCYRNTSIAINREYGKYYIYNKYHNELKRINFQGGNISFNLEFHCKINEIDFAYLKYIDRKRGYSKGYEFPLIKKNTNIK